jgi:hypothetical protein
LSPRAQASRVALAGAACLALSLAFCGPASGSRGLTTGIADGLYGSPDAATRNLWLGKTVEAGARVVRLGATWSDIAAARPGQPTNPGDPAYHFGELDTAIRSASQHGLTVLLTATGAPAWAEGPGRPAGVPAGTWQPSAADYGAFGQALARRYSGSFPGPDGLGPLPAVRNFQAWNEPNLSTYLNPQWNGRAQASAGIYRGLLNAFYDGVHAVQPGAFVVTAGTAPYGDNPGGARTRPLAFIRQLLCLKGRKQLKPMRCPNPAKLNALAHHPISTSGGPLRSAINPDDVSTPDLGAVTRVLRAAERKRTIRPLGGHRPIWVTEFWWNTNPPNTARGMSPSRQARAVEQSLYLFWKAGAAVAINLEIRDAPFLPSDPLGTNQSGLYYVDDTPKPSLTAFSFPFVTQRLSKTRVLAWGKAPIGGPLSIERRTRGTWRSVARLTPGAGAVFSRKLRFRGKAVLRATVGAQSSLPWAQR